MARIAKGLGMTGEINNNAQPESRNGSGHCGCYELFKQKESIEMKILFVIHDLDFARHLAVAYLSSIAKQLNHLTLFSSLDRDDMDAIVGEVKPEVIAYR